ncbi:MAG: SGNH/GDSL hydrolase family protein [Microthrixaceae bacterium]|nr:SGNH/GDSL hydrolase family protein [Microthrixaceae bacterium]
MKLVSVRSIRMAAAALALATVGAACAAAPTPGSGGGKLVALGDSFTANSFLLPNTSTNGCTQSKGNQPRLVASRLGIADVTDASCDGAKTTDIMGGSAPQIAKVTSSATVVMVSIGGNDLGFSDIAVQCSKKALTFRTCKGDYVSGGTDSLSAKVAATRPKIDQVLGAVKSRAPQARVVLYGYPTLLPMSGTSTCLGMTFAGSDVPYLRSKQAELNNMLKASAQANGVTYVDVYGPSAGHDPCSSTPWVNKVIDLPPLHPTNRGQTATGNLIADALD